jgi:hypothetical protein
VQQGTTGSTDVSPTQVNKGNITTNATKANGSANGNGSPDVWRIEEFYLERIRMYPRNFTRILNKYMHGFLILSKGLPK